MDSNTRKRKIESDESNDEDLMSEKSMALRSLCSLEDDDKQTYGLKQEFLKSLGITVPFDKWIYVTNFRCDKAELKEILELAGHVITCAMFARNGKRAKVMYSHPLEAVQAVSMLNGQTFYGQKLNVSMLPCPGDTLILPKGLANVGPGLGINGRPLREVVKHYSKYLKHKFSLIDQSLFNSDDTNEEHQILKEEGILELEANDIDDNPPSNDTCFKIANVEDFPDDVSNASENQTKKAKRDSDASEQESDDAKSNISNEEPKIIDTVTSRKEFVSKTATNPAPKPRQEIPRPQFTPAMNLGPQNYRPSMPFTNGPQMVPNPVMMGPCAQNTMIGSLPQGPAGPYTVPNRSAGPAVGPMGGSLRPVGPIGAPVAPMGHPGGPGPTARIPGPIGPISRAPGPIGPLMRGPGPFPPQGPPGPFQPSGIMPNTNLGPRPVIDEATTVPQITLQFRNLPPSTTFPLLCEKVAQCGQVLSLQLTTPGCAVARFAHKAHADRCFQLFNGKFIDGYVIEVLMRDW